MTRVRMNGQFSKESKAHCYPTNMQIPTLCHNTTPQLSLLQKQNEELPAVGDNYQSVIQGLFILDSTKALNHLLIFLS